MTKTFSLFSKSVLSLTLVIVYAHGAAALAGALSNTESSKIPSVVQLIELRNDLASNKDLTESDAVDIMLDWFVPLEKKIEALKVSGGSGFIGLNVKELESTILNTYQMLVCRGLLTDEWIRLKTKRVVSPCFDGSQLAVDDEDLISTRD